MAFEIDAIFPKRFTLFMNFVCAYLDGAKITQFLGELCYLFALIRCHTIESILPEEFFSSIFPRRKY